MSNSRSEPAYQTDEQRMKGYDKLIDRLEGERKKLQHELNQDYHDVRRFVRSYPEEAVLSGLAAGLAAGILIGKLLK